MRLLNTRTLQLSEFVGDSVPTFRYATLSHTWVTNEEISLQDLQRIHKYPQGRPPHPLTLRSGYQKIVGCCAQALRDGLDWAWVDTCCIDKTSSAELSEAINSMFQWYRDCCICYTYLSDVSDGDVLAAEDSEFRKSRWFTRGWTLQELLGPSDLLFFSKSWHVLGRRSQLHDVVSEVTGIPSRYLGDSAPGSDWQDPHSTSVQSVAAPLDSHVDPFSDASVAQRMAWASRRCTTRKEDLAYCLLGIFNVNIPLLYGEGTKAFQRLQDEIIKQTNDCTIFAWGYGAIQPQSIAIDRRYSYLATSPSDFAGCQDMVTQDSWKRTNGRGFEVTRKGMCIDIRLVMLEHEAFPTAGQRADVLGLLDCHSAGDLFNTIAIPLTWPKRDGEDVLVMRRGGPRLWPNHLSRQAVLKTVYITDSLPAFTEAGKSKAESDGAVIIPVMPFLSTELLSTDPSLAIQRPNGVDHLVVRETETSAPTLAAGRAYFRIKPTQANPTFPCQDTLIMILFQLSPTDDIGIWLKKSIQDSSAPRPTITHQRVDRNEPPLHDPPPDYSALELVYPAGPNKLRRKRKYFDAEIERRRARAVREGEKRKTAYLRAWNRRVGIGWRYRRIAFGSQIGVQVLVGSVHCLMTATPMISEDMLKDREYLKTLPWDDSVQFESSKQRYTFEIREEEVMGYKRGVLTIKTAVDDDVSSILGLFRSTLFFDTLMLDGLRFGRFAALAFLAFLSAVGASACIANQYVFAGALWMTLGMNCIAICLSQPRSDYDVPVWLLKLSLICCGVTAFFFSAFGPYGAIPCVVLFIVLSLLAIKPVRAVVAVRR